MAGETGEYIGQPGARVDAVELGALEQGVIAAAISDALNVFHSGLYKLRKLVVVERGTFVCATLQAGYSARPASRTGASDRWMFFYLRQSREYSHGQLRRRSVRVVELRSVRQKRRRL
jgi:hypothetical protein